jgi:cyclin-dependent kinase 12/13
LLRTEAHSNATKNIQNFTLLQASITDIINHNGGNAMLAGYRRSVSTLDFRTFDSEKISKLFGLDKDEAKKNFTSYDLQLICQCEVASSALAFAVM